MQWLLIARSIASRGFWALAGAGVVLGILQMVTVGASASSAPQQAAGAAMAAAYAVIPYVAARAFDQITRPTVE